MPDIPRSYPLHLPSPAPLHPELEPDQLSRLWHARRRLESAQAAVTEARNAGNGRVGLDAIDRLIEAAVEMLAALEPAEAVLRWTYEYHEEAA